MSKVLKKIDKASGARCGVLIFGKKPVASTFPKEEILYIKLAQQAFRHIFANADKNDFNYNEAHLQLGKRRLVCFRLEQGAFYIALFVDNSEFQKSQKLIRMALPTLEKLVSGLAKRL